MKRLLFIMFLLLFVLALAGCVRYKDGEPVDNDTKEEPKEETVQEDKEENAGRKKETSKKDDKGSATEVNEEFAFPEFTFFIDEAKLYNKDSKDYANIKFRWVNQAGDGKKQLMNLATLSVKQSDEELTDVDNSWDVSNNHKSPIYFPNAQNGEYKFDLTYEIDIDKPIDIVVMSLADGEKEIVTINN